MINVKYEKDLINSEMDLKKKLRDYRKNTQDFSENDPYTHSYSGYLFHSQEELNRFTDVDDLFFTDISV